MKTHQHISPLLPVILATLVSVLAQSTLAAERCVDPNSTNATPPYTDWSTAATNIQDAVDASNSGDTIRIAAGVYDEQPLIVDKVNLTLAGEPGSIIRATASMTQTLLPYGATTYPLLAMVRSQVVLTGLTFDGEQRGDSYPNALYGIVYHGSSGQVTNCTVRGFRGLSSTDSRGINVVNFVSLGTPTVNVHFINNTFADNTRSIVLSGDDANNPTLLRTSFTIEGNTFTGLGLNSEFINYGIVIFTGAGGEVKGNTMKEYCYTGAAAGFSSAISVYDGLFNTRGYYLPVQPVRYEGNTFYTNDHHLVLVTANDSSVVSNAFLRTGPGVRRWGSVALSGTNIIVAHNTFSDMPISIELLGGDLNGTFLRGVATNPRLHTNRFCRVYEPIHAQPLANAINELGTELPCPTPSPRDLHVPSEYLSIQEAVDAAAPGDTIHIAAGDYYEQIVIANKGRLTLVGEPGAVIHATNGMEETLRPYGNWIWYPVLGIYRTEVVLSGLTVDGEQLGELYSGSTRLRGIYFLGSSGTVTNCTVKGFRGSTLMTSTDANALHVFNPLQTGSPEVNVAVLDSSFADNEGSVVLRGDPGANPQVLRARVMIKGNTITGLGLVPVWNAGIWIVCGVAGDVIGNRISDHATSGIEAYDGAAPNHGRFVPLQPVSYSGNTLSNNKQHLRIFGGNESRVMNNTFLGSGPSPQNSAGVVLSGTNIIVNNNNFSDRPLAILVGTVAFPPGWPGWPEFPLSADLSLTANWFCNVPEPIRVEWNRVSGFKEQGTETNCPFTPRFQSISRPGPGDVRALLRGWHDELVVIESSTNLVDWFPVCTNTMALPTFEYRDTNQESAPQRFYRAHRP